MPAPSAPRRVAAVAVVGLAPLALTSLAAAPASAHGSMGDPVSRVSQCHAEGPENPKSAACKAAVAAGGTQALYDWNGIRIGNAAGKHQELIPDGKLCSANDPAFKGMGLARADWPATGVSSGSYTFKYRVTAPHKGTFKVYITKPGYDPSQPLGWGDLDLSAPVATATDPVASGLQPGESRAKAKPCAGRTPSKPRATTPSWMRCVRPPAAASSAAVRVMASEFCTGALKHHTMVKQLDHWGIGQAA
ncbi:GlcNAc-binding protein A [Streptomyces violaceorubidus]